MSDKFTIYKIDDGYHLPWNVDYPTGFDENEDGAACETFEDAIAAFIEASERRCITCDRGAVEDRPWGWECTACGSYDVAVGCVKP
ncbi:hypothetical protein [Mycobacterium sp. PSTR-4-N]|uniref:hypothetical protein n=1 Tax=Mycobacterium sp. PSTR-4-N TaxID=2917745 RepID=UPI001F150F0B|nr:hypothetical protein [Mycobacterium sp. PSTR-4-N]MCG7596336.1 hypothetical protein [Mycobacterium sp. PSTR-4-N]